MEYPSCRRQNPDDGRFCSGYGFKYEENSTAEVDFYQTEIISYSELVRREGGK